MPNEAKSTAELTTLLKMAKQAPMSYVFAAGKTPDKHYFDLSRKRLPPTGIQLARKQTGNKPIAGTVRVDGKEIIFETTLPAPSKYELILMKYLRTLKMAGMKVVIRAPGEGGDEDDGKKKKA